MTESRLELMAAYERDVRTYRKADDASVQACADYQTAQTWREECRINKERSWQRLQAAMTRPR